MNVFEMLVLLVGIAVSAAGIVAAVKGFRKLRLTR